MRRLLIALLASTFLLAAPAPARAEPITLAILSAVGINLAAGSIAASIATFALTTAVSLTLSLVVNALKPKTPETAGPASGTDLNVQYGGDQPREVIFGTQATAGHHVYTNVFSSAGNSDNKILECIFVLSDGQCDGINKMWYNGALVTLVVLNAGPSPVTYVIDELRDASSNPLVQVKFYDGRYDQLADSELVTNANPAGRWTSNNRGRGVCYVYIKQYYDEGHQLTGVPSILVELRGNKLYDPRKDTTVGGSGPHRWGTPSTYEFSGNPAIIEFNYRRGIRVNDQVLVGMDTVAAGDLIYPMYFSAANDCDDAIPLLAGGTEPRYRCGITASADKQHSTTLDAIRQSMAGFSLERSGQFGPIAGVAQSSVFEFSDSDFIVGAKSTFSKYETRSNIATAVFGNFSDPAQKWAGVPFPARSSLTDDALMGERLAKSLDLTQVSSNAQAQRIAEIERRRSMMQAHGSQTLGADFIGLQPGDWGTYHSPYGDMIVQVGSLSLAGDDSVTFAWRQIASSVFSWTTAGELDPPAIPIGGQPGLRITAVAGFAINPSQVPADSGLTLPALLCTWTPILDPTILRIDIEYRVTASPATVLTFQADTPSAGIAEISGSVQANTAYEVRARPIANPDRTTTWTAWIATTSGTDHIVQKSLEAISVGFSAALRELVSQVQGSGLAELRDEMNIFAAALAEVRTRGYVNTAEVKDVVASREGDLSATITDVRTTAVNNESAIASLSTTLTATFGTSLSAAVTFELGALVKADGTTIAMGGLTLNANNKIAGFQIYNNGVASDFDIEVDNFRIGKSGIPGGAFVPIFTVATVGGTPKVALRGDMLVDGTILAQHMSTGSVNTSTVITDNIILRGHIVADTSTRIDVAQNGSQSFSSGGAAADLVTLSIISIGGQHLIVASVDVNKNWGFIGNADTGNLGLSVALYIDGASVRSILVQAFITQVANTTPIGGNAKTQGHFVVEHKTSLSAGSHTLKIVLTPPSVPGSVPFNIDVSTITAFEARR